MFRYHYIICIQRFWSDASYVSVKGMKTFCMTVYLRSCSLRKSKAHVLHAPAHHMQWLHTILPIYATRNSHVECHPQVVALVPVLGQGYSNLYEDTQVVLLLTLIEVLLHSLYGFLEDFLPWSCHHSNLPMLALLFPAQQHCDACHARSHGACQRTPILQECIICRDCILSLRIFCGQFSNWGAVVQPAPTMILLDLEIVLNQWWVLHFTTNKSLHHLRQCF